MRNQRKSIAAYYFCDHKFFGSTEVSCIFPRPMLSAQDILWALSVIPFFRIHTKCIPVIHASHPWYTIYGISVTTNSVRSLCRFVTSFVTFLLSASISLRTVDWGQSRKLLYEVSSMHYYYFCHLFPPFFFFLGCQSRCDQVSISKPTKNTVEMVSSASICH